MISSGGLEKKFRGSSKKHASRRNEYQRPVGGVPGDERAVLVESNCSHSLGNGQVSIRRAQIRAAVAITSNVPVALEFGFSVKRGMRAAIKADF